MIFKNKKNDSDVVKNTEKDVTNVIITETNNSKELEYLDLDNLIMNFNKIYGREFTTIKNEIIYKWVNVICSSPISLNTPVNSLSRILLKMLLSNSILINNDMNDRRVEKLLLTLEEDLSINLENITLFNSNYIEVLVDSLEDKRDDKLHDIHLNFIKKHLTL